MTEEQFEMCSRRIRKICKPVGVECRVLSFPEYEQQKAQILMPEHKSKYTPALKWLYDPDSYVEDLSLYSWTDNYLVVFLESREEVDLEKLASKILGAGASVGIVCVFRRKRPLVPGKMATPSERSDAGV